MALHPFYSTRKRPYNMMDDAEMDCNYQILDYN